MRRKHANLASQLDEKRPSGKQTGKLHGVVISIKDVICYKDHPVTAASKILDNFDSIYNATAVERLLDEEAIIIGHTNCDEFAMGSSNENSFYGPVLNALDHDTGSWGIIRRIGRCRAGRYLHGKPGKRHRRVGTSAS